MNLYSRTKTFKKTKNIGKCFLRARHLFCHRIDNKKKKISVPFAVNLFMKNIGITSTKFST